MFTLTEAQITNLAQPIASMIDTIIAYYQDPEHEAAFQAWYLEEYGHPAPDDVQPLAVFSWAQEQHRGTESLFARARHILYQS